MLSIVRFALTWYHTLIANTCAVHIGGRLKLVGFLAKLNLA